MSVLSVLQSWDTTLLVGMRDIFFVESEFFRSMIVILGDSEPILFSLFLVGLWLWGRAKNEEKWKIVALNLFWHVLFAFFIYWIINNTLPLRPRPEMMSHLPPLINHLPDNSFPSGHALFWGASLASLLIFFRKPWAVWIFGVLGFITCLTRIVAGIHYPGDIIVGFALGMILVYVVAKLPHGEIYKKLAVNIPLKIGRFIGL